MGVFMLGQAVGEKDGSRRQRLKAGYLLLNREGAPDIKQSPAKRSQLPKLRLGEPWAETGFPTGGGSGPA